MTSGDSMIDADGESKAGWTEERVERLKKLWADGWSCTMIANALGGVSRNAVIGKVGRLKLPLRVTRTKVSSVRRAYKKPYHHGRPAPKTVIGWRPQAVDDSVLRDPRIITLPAPLPADTGIPAKLIPLIDWPETACRWPYGERPVLFGCTCPKVPGTPYCVDHNARAYGAAPTVKYQPARRSSITGLPLPAREKEVA